MVICNKAAGLRGDIEFQTHLKCIFTGFEGLADGCKKEM